MPTTFENTFESWPLFLKVLAYGQPSAGKTTFLGTSPEDRDDHRGRFLFNFESRNLLPLFSKKVKFEWVDIKSWDDLLREQVKLFARFKRADGNPPATVCVDGGGMLYKSVIMGNILAVQKKEFPDRQQYNQAHQRMLQFVNDVLDLPCHVIFTFHDAMDKDDKTGRCWGEIGIPGKHLPSEIMAKFNLVFHAICEPGTTNRKPEYFLMTKHDGFYPAGDKTTMLDTREEPDFTKILAKIQKGYGAQAQLQQSELPSPLTKELVT